MKRIKEKSGKKGKKTKLQSMVLNSAKYSLDGYYFDGKNAYRLYIKKRT